MELLLQFALLGIGPGAIYALAGLGLVQIHRGSGVLNFAQGAFALLSANLFFELWQRAGWPLAAAITASIAATVGVGALSYIAVMRPLHDASMLVRTIATIGLMLIVQQAVILSFDTEETAGSFVPSIYPTGALTITSRVAIGYDRLTLLGIAVALTALLWFVMRASTFGIATRAVAESALGLRAVGRSPDRVALASWALGAGLGGVAGVLIVPISGLSNTALLLVVVPALAAALIGGFQSYALTALGGLALGVGQSVTTKYATDWSLPGGTADALPLLAIVAVLALRGSALPGRGERRFRLPRVARRGPSYRLVAPAVGASVLVASWASDDLAASIATTALAATIAVSLVVVTGLTGQISLAQYALAGVGALLAARLGQLLAWPFPVLFVIGVVGGALVGIAFGLPSLRTRGPALAIATVGLGLAVEKVLFSNQEVTGGVSGTPVRRPTLFGWEISAISHPQRYAVVTLIVLAVIAVSIANLRSGAVGRRLLAVRSNERAATAIGLNVGWLKLFAFAVGAAIAAASGVLTAFRFDSVQYSEFGFLNSLEVLSVTLIGGVGYLTGALVGAIQVPTGVVSYLAEGAMPDGSRYIILISGVLLIGALILAPDGVVHFVVARSSNFRSRAAGTRRAAVVPGPTARDSAADTGDGPGTPRTAASGAGLQVHDLVVRYGGIRAVDGVSLTVKPGTITGLIGANGAGKTTLIDAIAGFVPVESGRIVLHDEELGRRDPRARAKAGLGRCFQGVELFDDMSVRENLLVASERIETWGWMRAFVSSGRSELPQHVAAIAHALELDELLDSDPTQLSHGRRRLVGVARALAAQPTILLLDEPAAGLDHAETRELGLLIRRMADEWKIGVLLVEHDVELVASISDELVVLDFGRTIFTGSPIDALASMDVRRAYLGPGSPDVELSVRSAEPARPSA